MSKDDDAFAIYEKALNIRYSDPRQAYSLLWDAANKYPETLTVNNYILDMLINIATQNQYWDDAIRACSLAQELKPDYRDSYVLEAQACELEKNGKSIEALEIRLRKDTIHGKWYGAIRDYGDKFGNLGAHDRAWQLYNEAIVIAIQDGISPHTVRQSMASLLQKENKPEQAVEQLIIGLCEAEKYNKKGIPKSLISSLRKAIRNTNIKTPGLIDQLVDICRLEGQNKALQVFREQIE